MTSELETYRITQPILSKTPKFHMQYTVKILNDFYPLQPASSPLLN